MSANIEHCLKYVKLSILYYHAGIAASNSGKFSRISEIFTKSDSVLYSRILLNNFWGFRQNP